jgi:hypothetical protein
MRLTRCFTSEPIPESPRESLNSPPPCFRLSAADFPRRRFHNRLKLVKRFFHPLRYPTVHRLGGAPQFPQLLYEVEKFSVTG